MAELLLAKGYRVIGLAKDMRKKPDFFLSSKMKDVKLIEWDMKSQSKIENILSRYKPIEIYNYAAYSSGEWMFKSPVSIAEINGLAVTRILEAINKVDSQIRFCQASSSEMFGAFPSESPQSEKTPFCPRSPYGASKLYAHSMIGIYRRHYGLFACSAILFNHESPRRGPGFVTRKIIREAVKIKLGLADQLRMGNLDTRRDWGFAGDYVRAMWLMLQQPKADDYVVATGKTNSVRRLCEIAFNRLRLDYSNYIRQDISLWRPSEPVELVGNAIKARKKLGWFPKTDFRQLVNMMVDTELKNFRKKR